MGFNMTKKLLGVLLMLCSVAWAEEEMKASGGVEGANKTKVYVGVYPEDYELEQQRLLSASYAPNDVVWLELGDKKSLAVMRHQATGEDTKGAVMLLKSGVHNTGVENSTVDDLAMILLEDGWDTLLVFLPLLPPPAVTVRSPDEKGKESMADSAGGDKGSEGQGDNITADDLGVGEDAGLPQSSQGGMDKSMPLVKTDYTEMVSVRLKAAAELLAENNHSSAVMVVSGVTAPNLILQGEVQNLTIQGLVLINAASTNSQIESNFFMALGGEAPVLDVAMGHRKDSRQASEIDEREGYAIAMGHKQYVRSDLPAQSDKISANFNRTIKRIRSWLDKLYRDELPKS